MGEAGDVACTASAWAGLGYRRREPERTLLHATVRAHLKTFLAEMEQRGDGAGLPGFVVSEFERYLACGIPATALPVCAAPPAATRCWSPCPAKAEDSVLPAPPVAIAYDGASERAMKSVRGTR